MKQRKVRARVGGVVRACLAPAMLLGLAGILAACSDAQSEAGAPMDPGVRPGPGATGGPLAGLTAGELDFFNVGQDEFEAPETTVEGLGPRFNLDDCVGCHSQPSSGGTAPTVNPQIAFATAFGQMNRIPAFLSLDGPIREVHFKFNADGTHDGNEHPLFVISGREDGTASTAGCNIVQEDFAAQVARNNVALRIPTPVFGLGLIEQIPNRALIDNLAADAARKAKLQISGRLNRSGGSVGRFGWKAQSKSLLEFAAEAYNGEMGISNELLPEESEEAVACQFAPTPNDTTRTDGTDKPGEVMKPLVPARVISDIEKLAFYMRLLAPPDPSSTLPGGTDSIARGRAEFDNVGCNTCHTPTLHTALSSIEALSNREVQLFSDLALHNMGSGLADDIAQGVAAGDEFRSAPLWGLGQRVFFLHDGRTSDLLVAISAHRSAGNRQFPPSEANLSIDSFEALSLSRRQDVLNFLRSL